MSDVPAYRRCGQCGGDVDASDHEARHRGESATIRQRMIESIHRTVSSIRCNPMSPVEESLCDLVVMLVELMALESSHGKQEKP